MKQITRRMHMPLKQITDRREHPALARLRHAVDCVLAILLIGLSSCAAPPSAGFDETSKPGVASALHLEPISEPPQKSSEKIQLMSDESVAPSEQRFSINGQSPPPLNSELIGQPSLLMPSGPPRTSVENESSPVKHPDEYIYDGGDRGLPVHYTEFSMAGLDPEDAIGEFRDAMGERHVKKTNRVAIYAPRFAAVRTISTLEEGTGFRQLADSNMISRGSGLRLRQTIEYHAQRSGSERFRTRARPSNLEMESTLDTVHLPVAIGDHVKTLNVFEEYAFVKTGLFKQGEEARLAEGIKAAATWTRKEYPVIAASTSAANEIRARFNHEELVGLNVKTFRGGKLRIVKLADKKIARRGETITFTIRFDNLGELPIYDVAIIDNLTARLSYITDSISSDREGQFLTEDNNAGSLILRWELDGPLAGGEGGVVTFKTTVE